MLGNAADLTALFLAQADTAPLDSLASLQLHLPSIWTELGL